MESVGWQPFETDFPRTDFVAVARAMGGDGVRSIAKPISRQRSKPASPRSVPS